MTQLKRTIIYMIVFCLIFLGLSYLVSINRVLRDGYAKDNWRVYYLGMRVEDANPGSFECLRDGYAKDAWSTFLRGRKIGR